MSSVPVDTLLWLLVVNSFVVSRNDVRDSTCSLLSNPEEERREEEVLVVALGRLSLLSGEYEYSPFA